MNKKIVSVVMSGLLSLGLVACSNNQDLEEVNTAKQEQKLEEEVVEDTVKDKEKSTKEKEKDEVIKDEDAIEDTSKDKKEWNCPICGSNYCPKDSECLNAEVCVICGDYGDLTKWTNSEGYLMITCDSCTEAMQLEDEMHRTKNYTCSTCGKMVQSNDVEWMGQCEDCLYNYNCEYCQDTGILPGGTICDACHCRGCGELKENCICNIDPEWDPSWSTKATDPVYCIHCNYANDPFGDFTCDGCGLDIFE